MFSFFRKHQRFFYAALALFVATSFISFGTWRLSSQKEDRHFTTPQKNHFDHKDLICLEYFLSRELSMGNLFNDGVISNDILQKGLGDQIFHRFEEKIGKELSAALPRELRWKPYTHPQLSYLNQVALWRYFCPSLEKNYARFSSLSLDTAPKSLFEMKKEMVLEQNRLSPGQLHHAILQQSELSNIDPELTPSELDLLGHRDLSSWFGENFLRLAAQVVLLGAEEAENSGIVVTCQETKADLLATAARLQRQLNFEQNRQVTSQEMVQFYRQCVQLTGLTEKQLTDCWRRILLFRHHVLKYQQGWGLDASLPLALDDFSRTSKRAVFYTLDDSFLINSPEQWEQFEVYCRVVANDALLTQELPRQFKEPHRLWAIAPQLLQTPCRIDCIKVSKSKLRAGFSLRQVSQWLCDDLNWSRVKAAAAKAPSSNCKTLEDRTRWLRSLKSSDRDHLEQLARKNLLKEQPELIEQALQQPGEEMEWTLNGAGLDLPFAGMAKPKEFVDLIKAAWRSDAKATQKLLRFEADSDTILSLRLLNTPNWTISTWRQARSKELLKDLVGTKGLGNCSRSEIDKAKQQAQMKAQMRKDQSSWLLQRPLQTLISAREQLKSEPPSCQVKEEGEPETFANQWQLAQKTRSVSRKDFKADHWPGLFGDEVDKDLWSSVQWRSGRLGFYRILSTPHQHKEGESIPPVDPQLIEGAERLRFKLAHKLDQDRANGWLEKAINHLNLAPSNDVLSGNGVANE